jgi:hypothetical protein
MTDEEMDAFVAKGIDLTVPEGGPVHTITEQELSDNELLRGKPSKADLRKAQDEIDKKTIRYFDPFEELPPFEPKPTLEETIIEDMVTHPLSTAEGVGEVLLPVMNPMGWIPAMADAIAMARDYAKGTALDKYLPEMGSPYEFLRHMDENPGDWTHLIGANSKLQDMIANPEDYAE